MHVQQGYGYPSKAEGLSRARRHVCAKVHSVVVDSILQLRLSVEDAVIAPALAVTGQSRVNTLHLTLVRLDDLGLTGLPVATADVPAPPAAIELAPEIYFVDTGAKQACYLVATPEMQLELCVYAMRCVESLGLPPSIVDPERVFHVTVSNAGAGQVRASVGAPWEFSRRVLNEGSTGAEAT